MGNQSQDEVFLAAQEAVGAHRDSQGLVSCKKEKEEFQDQKWEPIPEKSRARYERERSLFLNWCEEKNIKMFTEGVILDYFSEKSKTLKSSSLWSAYSMLKRMLFLEDNVDISKFSKLLAFLKREAAGYQARKTETFTREEINRFLLEAPDETYLMMKVVLIIGVAGACRAEELFKMTVDDIVDNGTILIITIHDSETKTPRICSVGNGTGEWMSIYRKYITLRARIKENRRLFVNFKNGKCANLPVGKNTFGKMPHKIAEYLELPNSSEYTGRCFRRTSVVLRAKAVPDILTPKKCEGWHFPST